MASTAPAAPSRWPVQLLVAVHRRTVAAERADQGAGLGDVAERRARRVGVDVADVLRLEAGVLERQRDAAGSTLAGRLGSGHVVGVGGHAGAGEAGVHLRAAGLRELLALEHQHAGALAEDEAVALLVVRAAGRLRLVVPLGQRAQLGEPGQRQRVHAGLRATGDDDVDRAGAQQEQRPGERLRAGRAGADGGVDPGAGAELQADRGGRAVGHEHRDEVRADPSRAALAQHVGLAEDRQRTADAGADHDGEPLGVDLGRAGVGPGLAGRDQRELLHAGPGCGPRPAPAVRWRRRWPRAGRAARRTPARRAGARPTAPRAARSAAPRRRDRAG